MARQLATALALLLVGALLASPLRAAAPRKPDLVVSSLTVPAAGPAGPLRPLTKVRNVGRRRAGRSTLRLYASRDARKDARDVRFQAAPAVKALAPRKSARVTAALVIPSVLAAGDYHVIACADDARRVSERDERNNCRASAGTFTVRASAPAAPAAPPAPLPSPSPSPSAEPAPGDSRAPETTITAGPEDVTVETTATLTFSADEEGATFRCSLDGAPASPCASPKSLSGLTADAQHTFEVAAVDTAGNVDASPAVRRWRVEPPAPEPPGAPVEDPPADPAGLAPQPGTGDVTDVAAGFGFLLDAQEGADDIDPALAGVVRGRVVNRMGAPVAGARVGVLDRPGFGHTATRVDGRFDLVVQGGLPVVLDIARAGYLPVQRTVTPPPADWTTLDEDVVMIPFDIEATEVAAGADGIQTVRGGPVEDGSGERQATLLFEAGTEARMRMPDGSLKPLEALTVRATEYTVGASGEEAMPGTLPATSAYTYAVELSVDEAVEAGAESVEFDRPVMAYLENFLEMPAGTEVPVGSYDRDAGRWVPEPDGRVIAVLAEAGGTAQVDVDGDGAADDGGSLGLDAAEKQKLASLYEPGDSLWRVPVRHFSPWDFNWPAGPPPGATPPDGAPPQGPPPDCGPNASGSIIGCEAQTLGEELELPGVDAALHYRSDRVPATDGESRATLNLTGATLPPGLKRVELTAYVAGRRYEHAVDDPAPGLKHDVVWDGRDAYGRRVQGEQKLLAEVRYVYTPRYYESREDFAASFASLGGTPITGSRSRGEISLSRFYTAAIGGWDARSVGLGGWTLGMHHAYDPIAKRLHLGDGTTRSADGLRLRTLRRVAGSGEAYYNGDGIPATTASLYSPSGVAAAPDGSVYIADGRNSRIRRVAPGGTISTVGGTGTEGFSGDGGPATAAQIARPAGMEVGPDGALYFADPGNGRIRRIRDGVMETVAGGGSSLADGVAAAEAWLVRPVDVALAPDGTLYISDNGRDRIRKLTPDGVVSTVAGGGFSEPPGVAAVDSRLHFPEGIDLAADGSLLIAESDADRITRLRTDGLLEVVAGSGPAGSPIPGDGGSATATRLVQPSDVAAEPDGSFHLLEQDGEAVRHVDPAGVITTVAGSRVQVGGSFADGRSATATRLSEPVALDRATDGTLLIVERFANLVRRIESPLPGTRAGELLLTSPDGAEVHRFSRLGRHLDTREALTGATTWAFAYDAAGRLTAVTDVAGLVTTIERDAAGKVTAVVGPGGHRTKLAVGSAGLLDSVERPSGETHAMTYQDGLLTGLGFPGGGRSVFAYDARRRLIRDVDAEGGEQTLSRVERPTGWTVTRTTPSGLKTEYAVDQAPDGTVERAVTLPSGATATAEQRPDGSTEVVLPDGTEVVTGPPSGDPRHGLLAPLATTTVTTPGGRTRTTTLSRSTVPAAPGPFGAQTVTEDVTTNGRLRRTTYTATTRELKSVSPAGVTTTTQLDAAGRVTGHRPATGATQEVYGYDARGRLSSITRGTESLTFAHDAADQLASATDATGALTAYGRDEDGRLATVTSPEQRTHAFGRDGAGHLASMSGPGGELTDLDADALGRLTGFRSPGAAAARTMAYDADRRLESTTLPSGRSLVTGYAADGQLDSLTTPETAFALDFDDAGRPVSAQAPGRGAAWTFDGPLLTTNTTTGASAGTFGHQYDADLRVATRSLSSGTDTAAWAFAYDGDGRPTKIGAFSVTRAGVGRAASAMADGTGTVAYGTDPQLRPASRSLTVAGIALHAESVTRDAAGRIATRTETVGGVTRTFGYGYDGDGQLTSVTRDGATAESYAYDARGNRVSRATGLGLPEASAYDVQDQLKSRGTVPYAQDLDGFVTQRGTDAFVYGTGGELLSAAVGAGTVTYAHDAVGRLVSRTLGGQTTRFLYGNPQETFEVTASRDGAGVLTAYTYDEHGSLVGFERAGQRYYVGSDLRGTPRVIADATGAVVKVTDYDAFGVALSDSAPAFEIAVGFAGGIPDPATGLVRFGLRDYDPAAGRWMARDPKLLDGLDTNLYRYAGNDPVGRIDRDGLEGREFGIPGKKYALDRQAPGLNCKAPESGGEFFACQVGVFGRGYDEGSNMHGAYSEGEAGYGAGLLFKDIVERAIDMCMAPPAKSPPPTAIDPKLQKAFDAIPKGGIPPAGERGPKLKGG